MLNDKKPKFWLITISIVVVIVIGISLFVGTKQGDSNQLENGDDKYSSDISGTIYHTDYDKVQIEFVSGVAGFMSSNTFETEEAQIVAFIDSTIRESVPVLENIDLNYSNNAQYTVQLSNDTGGYSCGIYYYDLDNKAYVVKDGGLSEVSTDFARYLQSLLDNEHIDLNMDKVAIALFKTHGWTLNYKISNKEINLGDIISLSGFDPNTYYFAYNNELSKDIDLDMSPYNAKDLDVEIYRIYESMPGEFYPMQDCRGIVVKDRDEIIGAFISAGRHSTFNACSLKGNSFEQITGQLPHEWIEKTINVDNVDERLSKLEPEQIIEEYFSSLDKKDAEIAMHCISKNALLENLTTNMLDSELFNEMVELPLTMADVGAKSSFDNLESAKLLEVELVDEPTESTKAFRVEVDMQYKKDLIISSGHQSWICYMVYESSQTGWKIESLGH